MPEIKEAQDEVPEEGLLVIAEDGTKTRVLPDGSEQDASDVEDEVDSE